MIVTTELTKVCSKCKQEKSRNDFYKNRSKKDGLGTECKQCNRLWAKNNPERASRNNRVWREKNVEKVRSNKKRWRKDNSEKIRSYLRDWRKENPGSSKYDSEYIKEYRKNNPTDTKARDAASSANKAAKKLGCKGKLKSSDIKKLWDSFPVCLACGKEERTVDHVVPLSKGGSNTFGNLQTLCFSCNSTKHDDCTDYRPQE